MTPWIPWSGGECPVASSTIVEVKGRRKDEFFLGKACLVEWRNDGNGEFWPVIAYRVSADGGEGE